MSAYSLDILDWLFSFYKGKLFIFKLHLIQVDIIKYNQYSSIDCGHYIREYVVWYTKHSCSYVWYTTRSYSYVWSTTYYIAQNLTKFYN